MTRYGHNFWTQLVGILESLAKTGGGLEAMLGADPATEVDTEGQSTIYMMGMTSSGLAVLALILGVSLQTLGEGSVLIQLLLDLLLSSPSKKNEGERTSCCKSLGNDHVKTPRTPK